MKTMQPEYVFDVACADCGARYQSREIWDAPRKCGHCDSTFIATKRADTPKEHTLTIHVTATTANAELFESICIDAADDCPGVVFEGASMSPPKEKTPEKSGPFCTPRSFVLASEVLAFMQLVDGLPPVVAELNRKEMEDDEKE